MPSDATPISSTTGGIEIETSSVGLPSINPAKPQQNSSQSSPAPKQSGSEEAERTRWDGTPLDPLFDCEDAGIYMIRSRKNGGFYVGKSVELTRRLNAHRTAINSGRIIVSQPLLRKGFAKHTEKDVEFRVLERITPYNSECESDEQVLKELEIRWIQKLQPPFNKYKKSSAPVFSSYLLPHGVPDDLKEKNS